MRKLGVCSSSLKISPLASVVAPEGNSRQEAVSQEPGEEVRRLLTQGALAELLLRHLVGDVGAHQHAHVQVQLLPDDV